MYSSIKNNLFYLANNSSEIDSLGLINGKLGLAMNLYYGARFFEEESYISYADDLIDEILRSNLPRLASISSSPHANPFNKRIQNTFSKKGCFWVQKFGTQSGFATGPIEQPSVHFQGYIELWTAMLFSQSGSFLI